MLGLGLGLGLGKGSGVAAPELAMANQANTTVTPADQFTITKSGGAADTWDASATSTTALAGDFVMRFTPTLAAKEMVFGLADAPLGTINNTNIDIAAYVRAGPADVIDFNNGGFAAGYQVAYTPGENWFIKRSGSTITVGNGGTDGVTGFTSRATYTNSATLYPVAALYTSGAELAVKRLS